MRRTIKLVEDYNTLNYDLRDRILFDITQDYARNHTNIFSEKYINDYFNNFKKEFSIKEEDEHNVLNYIRKVINDLRIHKDIPKVR